MTQLLKIFAYVIAAISFYGELTGNPYATQVANWLSAVLLTIENGGGTIPAFDIANFVIGPIPIGKKNAQGAVEVPNFTPPFPATPIIQYPPPGKTIPPTVTD
jgi:hypothetical protein